MAKRGRWPRSLVRLSRLLKSKSPRYWIVAALVLALSIVVTPYISDRLGFTPLRDSLFQNLSEMTSRRAVPRFVKVVLIKDDEYYDGEPKGIVPLNRHYLARLVDALDKADVALIALDFDLHIRSMKATGKPGRYGEIEEAFRKDTDALMRAISHAAESRQIVLPKTLRVSETTYDYGLEPDIFQPYGICNLPLPDGAWQNPGTKEFPLSEEAKQNIRCGYIELPYDLKEVPPVLQANTGPYFDSFSLAIAGFLNEDAAKVVGEGPLLATYIPDSIMDKSSTVIVSAHDLLAGNKRALKLLRHHPVIVGAAWHKNFDMGPQDDHDPSTLIDVHPTPIGLTSGALMHENYTEAILDGRLYPPIPDWLLHTLEAAFGILAALLFAAHSRIWIKVAIFVALIVTLFALQWLMLLAFGVFLEAFVPLFGLAVHSILERFLEHHATRRKRAHSAPNIA